MFSNKVMLLFMLMVPVVLCVTGEWSVKPHDMTHPPDAEHQHTFETLQSGA